MMNKHCNRTTQNQNDGNNKENFTFTNDVEYFTLFCTAVEFFIVEANCIKCIHYKSGNNQSCEHGDNDTKCQCISKALNSTGTKPHQYQ